MSDLQPPTAAAAIKHHLIVMVAAIVILDLIAIAAFYALHLNGNAGTMQQTFIGLWILVALTIVMVQQRKIRRARSGPPNKPKP